MMSPESLYPDRYHIADIVVRGPLRPPARCLAAGRLGPGRRGGKLGQVLQRVAEMLRAERREVEVLPDELRHRRPVVGERDLSLGRTERYQVVTPGPAAELQVTVALLLPRQPADGARRVEHHDLVGHLVVTVWMAGVIHVYPENLPHPGQRRLVGSFLDPAGAVDRRMGRRVRQHREHPRGGRGDSQGGAHVLLVHGVRTPCQLISGLPQGAEGGRSQHADDAARRNSSETKRETAKWATDSSLCGLSQTRRTCPQPCGRFCGSSAASYNGRTPRSHRCPAPTRPR